ncbi:response regulator [Hyphomicrobium sp. xq]|uniref:Response regulator n=1 Tax=Hyphomicrobium album TaxID=2665159 RepID=A0A6I3KHJ9_9HYPH|nr:response regulator [Hyphomicrobium album]MTD93167.1 response regulator [Hyphomicrobium album]
MSTDRLDAQTILVVEDEPFILLEIQRILEEVGARVLAARSVQEALALLAAEPITASILDYRLQGGTADDLCHQLTARKIPFVIYSGYTNVEGECNKWEIVSKPADPQLLVTRVLSVLVASALPGPQCP